MLSLLLSHITLHW